MTHKMTVYDIFLCRHTSKCSLHIGVDGRTVKYRLKFRNVEGVLSYSPRPQSVQFLNTDVAQTWWSSGRIFNDRLSRCKSSAECASETVTKIGQYSVKIWTGIWCHLFDQRCIDRINGIIAGNPRNNHGDLMISPAQFCNSRISKMLLDWRS